MYVSVVYENEDYRMGIEMKIAGSHDEVTLLVFLLVMKTEISWKSMTSLWLEE